MVHRVNKEIDNDSYRIDHVVLDAVLPTLNVNFVTHFL